MANREFRDRLKRRAKAADITIEASLLDSLEVYYQLLCKWNAKINLTAFRLTPGGEDDAVDRLLIEPVVASKYSPQNARTILDAGSGGGSPAIPLKLAVPQLQLRMVEVKTRKTVFLREAVRTLGLSATEVETSRFEELLSRPDLHEAFAPSVIQGGKTVDRGFLYPEKVFREIIVNACLHRNYAILGSRIRVLTMLYGRVRTAR